MSQHLPILQVLLPLLCAPLCALLRSPRLAWALFLFAASASLVCAVMLNAAVADGQVLRYSLGSWEPPYGIEYVIDRATTPLLLLISGAAVLVAIYARRSIEAEIEERRRDLYYACLCLCLTGLLGIVATGDAFNVFVFLEISSLSSYALIALGRRRQALLSAFRYLVLGTVGATFLLIGIGLMYALTGTLNMADLAQRLPELYGNRALTASVLFVFIGVAIKMALFPLHAWLPGAYAESPSAVGVLLSATGTKVAVYVLLRFSFSIFGAALVFELLPLKTIGLILGCVAMVMGAAVACFQTNFKRLLAWSSIGQIGYIVAGFSLATSSGLSAAYLHLINHAVIKAALFAAAGLLLLRLHSVKLSAMAGLGRRMPWTFAAIAIAGFGLVGVPPTAGFASKWALVLALIEQGQWLVLGLVLFSSILALIYVGRVIEIGWFRAPPESTVYVPAPPSMVAVTWGLVLLSLVFGLYPQIPAALADGAAAALLGTAP